MYSLSLSVLWETLQGSQKVKQTLEMSQNTCHKMFAGIRAALLVSLSCMSRQCTHLPAPLETAKCVSVGLLFNKWMLLLKQIRPFMGLVFGLRYTLLSVRVWCFIILPCAFAISPLLLCMLWAPVLCMAVPRPAVHPSLCHSLTLSLTWSLCTCLATGVFYPYCCPAPASATEGTNKSSQSLPVWSLDWWQV